MQADALLCSHPRSGGRWLRYLVARSLAAHHRLELETTPQSAFAVVPDHHDDPRRGYPAFRFRDRRDLPLVAVCHRPYSWEHHRTFPVVFLARNPYDVMVSGHAHALVNAHFSGTIRDFIRHPSLGLPGWIRYMNGWAPKLLTHPDALLLSYGELTGDTGDALRKVLDFLDQRVDGRVVEAAVQGGNELRSGRGIRTGQEGNFWDHLQPEEIFEIHETLHRDLSEFSSHLLARMGVETDPFPRSDP